MKLIVSYRTYEWATYCAGLIMRDPKNFTIMIICRDDIRRIEHRDVVLNLCKEAVYAQRHYDLEQLGKALKVPKVMNLLYDEELLSNEVILEKLIMQLQLQVTLGGIKEVYYYDIALLSSIFKKMEGTLNVTAHGYGNKSISQIREGIRLSRDEMREKESLGSLMVGRASTDYTMSDCIDPHERRYELFS